MSERVTLSTKEVAHRLGVSKAHIYNEIQRGNLAILTFGKWHLARAYHNGLVHLVRKTGRCCRPRSMNNRYPARALNSRRSQVNAAAMNGDAAGYGSIRTPRLPRPLRAAQEHQGSPIPLRVQPSRHNANLSSRAPQAAPVSAFSRGARAEHLSPKRLSGS